MAKLQYQYIADDSILSVADFCRDIARIREEDVEDFSNLNNVFISGRKVGKVPTGSADIAVTDRIGDFNFDANFIYICVDDSGAAWRRVTLEVW